MPIYRTQVILQGFTELPQDRYTNTFHFFYDASRSHLAAHAIAAVACEALYDAIGANIAAYVNRTAQVSSYNLSEPPVRVPITSTFTFPSNNDPSPTLPPEVSVVMGYRAALPHTGRRRNRVFLGPWGDNVVTAGSATAFPTVSSTLRTNIVAGAQAMFDAAIPTVPIEGEGWVIWSATDNGFSAISQVYVDDEFDTQRRRGFKTTTRTLAPINP